MNDESESAFDATDIPTLRKMSEIYTELAATEPEVSFHIIAEHATRLAKTLAMHESRDCSCGFGVRDEYCDKHGGA